MAVKQVKPGKFFEKGAHCGHDHACARAGSRWSPPLTRTNRCPATHSQARPHQRASCHATSWQPSPCRNVPGLCSPCGQCTGCDRLDGERVSAARAAQSTFDFGTGACPAPKQGAAIRASSLTPCSLHDGSRYVSTRWSRWPPKLLPGCRTCTRARLYTGGSRARHSVQRYPSPLLLTRGLCGQGYCCSEHPRR